MAEPSKKRILPSSIDQGWATVIAGLLTIVGVAITLWVQRDPPTASAPVPSVVPTITPGPTQIIEDTIVPQTPTISVTPEMTPTPGASVPVTPAPQLVSLLPEAQEIHMQQAGEGLLQAAQDLPLIVKDDFDNNDYGWPTGNTIFNGGIECNFTIQESAYQMTVHSANGPAYCISGITRIASDFILSLDQQLVYNRNAEIFLYYRLSDDGKNFYFLVFNPQTQLFSVGISLDSHQHTIIGSTYLEEINKNGANKTTLLAIGSSHAVYVNDKLIALYNDDRIAQGQFRLVIQLQEANLEESLLTDRFDLRGN